MKTHPSRQRGGFTLIELLVVIAIIAVLSAAGFGVANIAMTKARTVSARNVIASLDTAISGFYNEYGHLPDPSAAGNTTSDTSVDTTSADGVRLLTILMGKETGNSNLQNPRGISFLTVPTGKAKKNGLTYVSGSSSTIEGLYDPWGSGYQVILDFDYDEEIKDPIPATGSTGAIIRGKRAAIYSKGADKVAKFEDPKSW